MYYYGFFRSNDTSKDPEGQLYKAVIITDFQNLDVETVQSEELMMADSPFVVEYATEETDLFKPYKCSTATVSFYQENLNYNIISSTGDDVFVQLLKLKEPKVEGYNYTSIKTDAKFFDVEWVGFATPNTYSQSFNSIIDSFQLECQDAFSILKYYDYQKTNETSVSMVDILLRYVKILKCYKNIYISNNSGINQYEEPKNILEVCSILNRNFFDEDNQPEKVIDILENMFRFYGLSCVPYKDSLYLVNYKAILEGYNEYKYYYQKENGLTFYNDDFIEGGSAQLSDTMDIKKEDFASNDTKVSFVGTFNKVKVKDDMYVADTSIVDLSDTSNVIYPSFVYNGDYHIDNVKEKYSLCYLLPKEPNGQSIIDTVKFHMYRRDRIDQISEPSVETLDMEDVSDQFMNYQDNRIDYSTTQAFNMACYLQYDSKKVDDLEKDDPVFSYKKCYAIFQPPGIATTKDGEVSWSGFPSDLLYGKGAQAMIDFIGENFTYTKDCYLMFSGSFYHYPDTRGVPVESTWTTGPDYVDAESQWCSLQLGDLWYNGTDWQTEEVRFSIPRDLDNKSTYLSSKPIKDTNKGAYGIEGSGYVVKLPEDDVLSTKKIQFTIYRPFVVNKNSVYPQFPNYYRAFTTLIKDFNIELKHGNLLSSIYGNDDSDTEYSATVISGAVEDYDDIEQKITTWDNKSINYSSVLYSDYFTKDGVLEKNKDYLAVYHDKATGEITCAEEHIINSICSEYKKPKILFTATLHKEVKPYELITYHYFREFQNYYYLVVDSQSIDYAYNTNTITAVQIYDDKFTDKGWDKKTDWLQWYQTNFKELIQQFNKQRDYYRNGSIVKDSKIKTFGEKPITSIFYSYDEPEGRFSIEDNNLKFNIEEDVIYYNNGTKATGVMPKVQLRDFTNNLTIQRVIPWAFISTYWDNENLSLYVPNSIYRSAVYKIENGNLIISDYGSL